MDKLMGTMRATGYGAVAPAMDVPPVLPCGDAATAIDWFDFSQTLNPLGTPAAFTNAMHRISRSNVTATQERAARAQTPALLARLYGVAPENVAVGASATDVLAAVANAFEAHNVAVPVPSRASFEQCLGTAGHHIVEIPSPDGFVVPDPAMAQRLGMPFNAAMLANPAFPTSRLLSRQTLLDYLAACDWVIVDERGIDLTLGGESMVGLLREHSNLIIIRSLTDAFSLPGLPLSCALAHPAVARRISLAVAKPTSATLTAELAKLAAFEHHLDLTRELLDTEIPWMQCMLSLVPGISIFPAEANFVMCAYQPGTAMQLGAVDTTDLVHQLQARGFLVRTLDRTPGVEPGTHFCVSVRTRPENERFIAALRAIVLQR